MSFGAKRLHPAQLLCLLLPAPVSSPGASFSLILSTFFCCKLPSPACCLCQAAGFTSGCSTAAFCIKSFLPPLFTGLRTESQEYQKNPPTFKTSLFSDYIPKLQVPILAFKPKIPQEVFHFSH